MHTITIDNSFDAWRTAARDLLAADVAPEEIVWTDNTQSPLLIPPTQPAARSTQPLTIPKSFIDRAPTVACHRDPDRWSLVYRIAFRLTHGQSNLLQMITDDDVRRFDVMEKSVRRDRHKMTAFVRFRKLVRDGQEYYVAWYRPDHYIVRLASDHFRERFAVMKWSILTPDECVHWDAGSLSFSPGVTRDEAPRDDDLEALWLTYYGSIFNPARIKIGTMKKEMPVRFWRELPEAHTIPDLLEQAPARVEEMVRRSQQLSCEAAMTEIPDTTSLKVLAEAASKCTRCPLYQNATQTVFGEGPSSADVVFVGEQPGDFEDRAGKPFVGPAGQLFDEVLQEVGIDRSRTYVTNAVKHFKFEPRGTRRIHAKPSAREVAACHAWLDHELKIIKPKLLVLLGATAAQSVVGSQFRITKQRGSFFASDACEKTLATWHPSALLRAPDEDARRTMRKQFADDLSRVAKAF